MTGNQLTATSSGGSQTATQSPQSVGGGSLSGGQQSGSLQTGTPRDALNKSSATGISLNTTTPNAVTLANLPKTTTSTSKDSIKQPRHTTPIGSGLSLLFVVAALILLWSAARPVKNTTD